MAANKNNVTKRSDVNRPLTYVEGDTNFEELKNVITDQQSFESQQNTRNSTYEADISDLQIDTNTNTNDITGLRTDVDTNTGDISGLRTDVDTDVQNLLDHENAADPHPQYATDTKVDGIDTRVGTLETSVSDIESGTTDLTVTSETGTENISVALNKRVEKGEVGNESVTTSTGVQSVTDALDQRGTVFDSAADMKAASGLTVGIKVRTLGYYAPGDGGGNDYEIVASATGTDDGGSFIDLAGSGLQAKGLFGSFVNVRTFGAVGDGVADDYSAIQSAIDYSATLVVDDSNYPVTLSSILIPSGTYLISSGNSLIVSKGVAIRGESLSSSRFVHGGGSVPCIATNETSVNTHIHLSDFSVYGSSTTTYGIRLANAYRDSNLERVHVRDCQTNVYLKDCFTFFVDRCDFQFASSNQVHIINATAMTIFNCRMDNSGGHGVFLDGITEGTVHCIFDNNQIQRCQKAGIYAIDIDSIHVNNGYFEGNNRENGGWSDVHWDSGARNRGTNGSIINCYATATTGGTLGRFCTVDIPGVVSFIANRNYYNTATTGEDYEYGVYIGSKVQRANLYNNKLSGTVNDTERQSQATEIFSDSNFSVYTPTSKVSLQESSGNLSLFLTPDSGSSSILFGDSADTAQAAMYYFPDTKRLQFNGFNNASRLIIKEQGQLRMPIASSEPTIDVAGGDVYFDASLGRLRVYDGTSWINLH